MNLTALRTTEEITWRLHETVKDEHQAHALMTFYKEHVGYQAVKVQVRQVEFNNGQVGEVFEILVLEFKGGVI